MTIPIATYRLQLNPSFGFEATERMLPYLAELGVSHIYASPIFAARPGSAHGYDVVDPLRINDELGGEVGFLKLRAAMRERGLCWIQDIVPNHMAFDSANLMLMDVLENGEASPYYDYFDIDWNHPYENMHGRVLAPVLGKFYADALESGDIRLTYDQRGLGITYYDLRLPLKIETYPRVFEPKIAQLEERAEKGDADVIKFLGAINLLQSIVNIEDPVSRIEQVAHAKLMLWYLHEHEASVRALIDECVSSFNGTPGDPESFNALDGIISDQLFKLSFWKVAAEEINYRRFFTVNDLISLKVERPDVFDHVHGLIGRFIREGAFDGIRVDHVDGLYDPAVYLERLRELCGDTFIVIEKILESSEKLPAGWPVQGTTGYDFLDNACALLCNPANERAMNRIYGRFTYLGDYEEQLADKKRLIVGRHLAGNIDNLAQLVKGISSRSRYGRDMTLYGLRRAMVEVMANFSVYRTYVNQREYREVDRARMALAVERANASAPAFSHEIWFLRKFLMLEYDEGMSEEDKAAWVGFVMNFQQFTAPLMAKGFEDTFLYIYNRLISLNDVGGSPDRFGMTPDAFHAFCLERSQQFRHSLNATSTHDAKRGEDARMRIDVLSEIPKEWDAHLKIWTALNRARKKRVRGKLVPDANDEYFLYQTLIGVTPFDGVVDDAFRQRVRDYAIKALREAKLHTAWIKPDEDYEGAYLDFIDVLLSPSEGNRFWADFLPFQRKVAFYGAMNSLSQTLLKIACPGVPDFYQGAELWDLSLVDPDNRRPVDFEKRRALLSALRAREAEGLPALAKDLMAHYEDGRVKLFMIYRLLRARQGWKDVFDEGEYVPLPVEGEKAASVYAFLLRRGERCAIAIVPRLLSSVTPMGVFPTGRKTWGDTRVVLPQGMGGRWTEAIVGQEVKGDGVVAVAEAMRCFPAALLLRDADA
jgi:(1->4)-alpha-D-glucan 1-alpha-D-glucosylmutase